MANYKIAFSSVSIPTNSGGISVAIEEDENNDGTTDTSETISLSDGTTEYTTSSDSFTGNGQVALDFDIGPPSDVTVTSASLFPASVMPVPEAPTEWAIHTKYSGSIDVDYLTNFPRNIQRGNTININVNTPEIELLQDLIEYGGSYKTLEGTNGEIYFDETVPSSAEIDSLVVGIEPNSHIQDRNGRGVWGIVDSATDNRPKSLTTNQIGLNVLVLAEYSDYASHTDLESELKMNV